MEDMQPDTKPKPEPGNQDEQEDGMRRRLRDRDLLRKRKAEAEEKETNQAESQRKRSRAETKSGPTRRGRPRKVELVPTVLDEAAGGIQETPAVVVAPEPAAAFISDQIYEALASIQAVEPQPAPPAPTLQTVVFQSAVGPSSDPASSQDPVPETGLAPPQLETLYMEPQDQEAPEQVLIEDLGPDEEEEEPLAEGRRNDEGLSGSLLIDVPEQIKMNSVPAACAPLLPQEYFAENSL
ncbi:uncharacterized protein hemgn isoform X2 [Nematolebias whitei]|uniref:uncharacterized protein hemgn isoform X2 n=1 Tax=Nematolebias whitei TaxID=451745 RepID=UPI001896CE39|nr:uncharacterized protein hemgn isoform X2 [Nematolebias whitei]